MSNTHNYQPVHPWELRPPLSEPPSNDFDFEKRLVEAGWNAEAGAIEHERALDDADMLNMGDHIIDGEFQSDKYPWCRRGFVPLKLTDLMAQPFLWDYARQREGVDREFAEDLRTALRLQGYEPPHERLTAAEKADKERRVAEGG